MTTDNTTPHKSSTYDQDVRQTIPFYETMQVETVDLVRRVFPDAKRWLDTGCGTGYLTRIALPFFPKTEFILADPSEPMLELARKNLEHKEDQVKFLKPVGSQQLESALDGVAPQVVTAIQCHHYLSSRERRLAVQSCYKILAEGGLFVTFENIMPYTQEGIQIGLERWKYFQLAQGRTAAAVENHLTRFNTKYFPISIDDHLALYKEVGFRIIELFWYSYMQAGFYALK